MWPRCFATASYKYFFNAFCCDFQHRFLASALYSFAFCIYFFGWKAFLVLIAQSFLVFSIAHMSHSALLVWLGSLPLVYFMNSMQTIKKMVSPCHMRVEHD